MVKSQNKPKKVIRQGLKDKKDKKERVTKITANTPVSVCEEKMTAFGGLLALVKLLDLLGFEKEFGEIYVAPKRKPQLGHCRMVSGLLMLLFIGFQRLNHFVYLRQDGILCGFLKVSLLPVVSTFWRYLRSLGFIQSASLLRLSGRLREKVWQLTGYAPKKVRVNIDTTTLTVYGDIEGSRKGYNPKHRGKKGLRPVLCFLDETREYLCGIQRRGETMRGAEVGQQIRSFRELLPGCVKKLLVSGDGEFIGGESVKACKDEGFEFVFGNKVCKPPFSPEGWYRWGEHEYNECVYQPRGWEEACRFVAMRIMEEKAQEKLMELPEMEGYVYRVFATNLSGRPHQVIAEYDVRADVENLIGESQREGLLAIPSKRFQSNMAFFQIVMLAYNLWRWMKLLAGHCQKEQGRGKGSAKDLKIATPDHTLRIARLKMLFVAAKIQYHGHQDVVKYSLYDERTHGMLEFLKYLDKRRKEERLAA